MSCEQVRKIIAGLPRRQWSAEQNAHAERHMRECEACRAALSVAERLDAQLGALPELPISESMTPGVMAAIERRRAAARDAATNAVPRPTSEARCWWAISLGAVLGLCAYFGALLSGAAMPLGFGRLSLHPLVAVAAAGILLCLSGASLVTRDRPKRPASS